MKRQRNDGKMKREREEKIHVHLRTERSLLICLLPKVFFLTKDENLTTSKFLPREKLPEIQDVVERV